MCPSVLTWGIKSFMRLKARKNVDFPHPEGPIIDVIWLHLIGSVTFFSAQKSS
jgi:hypothetical protein